jgi:hypothetical protein
MSLCDSCGGTGPPTDASPIAGITDVSPEFFVEMGLDKFP